MASTYSGAIAPVALGVEVAQEELILEAELDAGDGAGDFAGDEGFAAARGFVVEQDAVAGVQAVAFAVIDRGPVGEDLGAGVGAARIEEGCFVLRAAACAEHFAGGGLVEAAVRAPVRGWLRAGAACPSAATSPCIPGCRS